MVKEIELNAPLDILNKVEATGLPCHWNGVSLVITLDDDSSEDLFKLGKALSGAKKVTYHVLVLCDLFPEEYYQHFNLKSDEERYRHFDDMINVVSLLPKTKESVKVASRYASARKYYESKLKGNHGQ